jgi:hypothetical protein
VCARCVNPLSLYRMGSAAHARTFLPSPPNRVGIAHRTDGIMVDAHNHLSLRGAQLAR